MLLTLDTLALSLACSAASVTVSKTHITEGVRAWLWKQPRLRVVAYLADCPYCISHWVAAALVAALIPWSGVFPFLVQTGEVIALSAIAIGAIMKLMGWDQRDLDKLRGELTEAHEVIAELTR